MGKRKFVTEEVTITIDKLVHGGQGLGLLDDGRKGFVSDKSLALSQIRKAQLSYLACNFQRYIANIIIVSLLTKGTNE